ncbi:Plectin/S10 domain-containing protein [Pavlovales sp. CCMP2436]|nr:Plectin/S10 domain-containing protein [Pavlovales sp. CCMP2436]
MLVTKKNRLAVYNYLFKEGVVCAKKDYRIPKHPEIDASNLEVIKLCVSLKARGLVHEIFSWQWFYWSLTDEGIEYLREYLHLPADEMPNTLKKSTKDPLRRPGTEGERRDGAGRGGGDRPRFGDSGGRDGYRGDKKEGEGYVKGSFGRGGGGAGAPGAGGGEGRGFGRGGGGGFGRGAGAPPS